MLTAIDKEPKMLLGLPKQSYHLIKLLSENIPHPTLHILITLKKIILNKFLTSWHCNLGIHKALLSVFSKRVPLIAAK